MNLHEGFIKIFLCLGVLTGVGSEADLSHADIILKDITQVCYVKM